MTIAFNTNQPLSCSICLEGLASTNNLNDRYEVAPQDHDVVFLKRCSHLFHQHCILPWLDQNENCPYCRGKVLTRFHVINFDNFLSLYSQYLNGEIERKNLRPDESVIKMKGALESAVFKGNVSPESLWEGIDFWNQQLYAIHPHGLPDVQIEDKREGIESSCFMMLCIFGCMYFLYHRSKYARILDED